MNFDISEDQRMFGDQVDRYFRDTCPLDRLHKAFDGDKEVTAAITRGMMELGLGSIVVPEEYDGLGLTLLEASSISERIGYAGAPGPWISHTLAAHAIAIAGSDDQKSRWLPRLATGVAIGTIALMEGDEWQVGKLRLQAESKVSGEKDFVMGLEEAHVIVVVFADGALGLVESGSSSVTCNVWPSTDLTRPVGQLVLDRTPVDLMPKAAGADIVDAALVLIASDAHGGALRMVEDIVEYSKERVQFDQPIGKFQAVKHKLADLAVNVELNGPLCRQAAATVVQEPENGSLAASIAKGHLADVFSSTARIATESYGGIGYTWEHQAHIWLRRSMFDYAWMGTPAEQRQRSAELSGW